VFGQCDAAQSHLARHGVGPGDLFLFFGWFRAVERVNGEWRYVPGAADVHAIFGWLQVDEVVAVGEAQLRAHPWLAYHPHCHGSFGANNTIYTARPRLALGEEALALPGAGAVAAFHPARRLTAPGAMRRSEWRLPPWCFPRGGVTPLSYHQHVRWSRAGDSVTLTSVPRGQEFVLDTAAYPEALAWARELLAR
jgi:hypothetical protein